MKPEKLVIRQDDLEDIMRWELMIDLDTKLAMRKVLEVLNKAVELDPKAMEALCESRVMVNKDLACSDLPLVLLQDSEGLLHLGFIGALQGCLQAALNLPDELRLCAVYEEDGSVSGFHFLERCDGGKSKIVELGG